MQSLLIVYHSQSGASAELARAACRGANSEAGISVRALRAWDAGIKDIDSATGLMLVAAENSATVNGGMKDFLDRTFYPACARERIIPYMLLLSAGNDGRGAAGQVQRIMTGVSFPAAAEPLILRGEVGQEHRRAAQDMGTAFAAGLVMGIF